MPQTSQECTWVVTSQCTELPTFLLLLLLHHVAASRDSGIGMTKEQLLENLGTIARSGTRKFMEMMKESKGDNNLIGQFGVGFYSAFLVADRVTVTTKSAEEDKQWLWSAAAGSHEFRIKEDTGASLVRGTRVVLHVKEDAAELADPVMLARLIKQYSQFISFPIKLFSAKKEPVKVTDDDATKRKQEAADKKAEEEGKVRGGSGEARNGDLHRVCLPCCLRVLRALL